MKSKKRKAHIRQLGGGLSSLFSLFGNEDFSVNDTLELGSQASGVFPLAVAGDNPDLFVDSVVNGFSSEIASQGVDSFLDSPTVDGLEDLGLSDRITRKLKRRIEKGKDIPRRFKDNVRRAEGNLAQNTSSDINQRFDLLSGLFGGFESLLDFQQGGRVHKTLGLANSIRQRLGISGAMASLGFRDDSPFQNAQSLTIPGNTISMDNVSRSLALIPDVGNPKIAPPNSGTHRFPRAQQVVEIPVMRKGGKPRNIYKQEGSAIDQVLGAEEEPDLTSYAVQLETNEIVATPGLDILDTRAKLPHEDMEKDLVTDIFRGTDYVFSDHETMTLSREDADNISFGYGGLVYSEDDNRKGEFPTEFTLAVLYRKGEEELTFARLAERVRKRYPIRKGDALTDKTSFVNKERRAPYLQALAYLNERQKNINAGIEEPTEGIPFTVNFKNPYDNATSAEIAEATDVYLHDPTRPLFTDIADPVEVTAFQAGGGIGMGIGSLLSSIPAGIQGIQGMFQARQQGLAARRLQRDNAAALNAAAERQRGFAGAGAALTLAALGLTDPTVQAPQLDNAALLEMDQRIPRSVIDNTASRIGANNRAAIEAIFANSGDFTAAIDDVARINAGGQRQIANLGQSVALENQNIRNRFLGALDRRRNDQIRLNADATERTRQNVNANIGTTANVGVNFLNNLGTVDANLSSALLANDNSAFAADQAARSNSINALGFGMGASSQGLANVGFNLGSAFGGQNNPQPGVSVPSPGVSGIRPQSSPLQVPSSAPLFNFPELAPRVPFSAVPAGQSVFPGIPFSIFG